MKIEPHEILKGELEFTVVDHNDEIWNVLTGARRITVTPPEGYGVPPYRFKAYLSFSCIATYPKSKAGNEVDPEWTQGNYIVQYSISDIEVLEQDRPPLERKFLR